MERKFFPYIFFLEYEGSVDVVVISNDGSKVVGGTNIVSALTVAFCYEHLLTVWFPSNVFSCSIVCIYICQLYIS